MNALDRRVNAVPTGQPVTQASLTRYAAALQPLIAEYGDLLTDAEASHKSVLPIKDSTVSTLWLVLIITGDSGLTRRVRPAPQAYSAEIARRDAALTRQATALN